MTIQNVFFVIMTISRITASLSKNVDCRYNLHFLFRICCMLIPEF